MPRLLKARLLLPHDTSQRRLLPPSVVQPDDIHAWALVLAAGEGSRLKALTMTPSGVHVPKQFCSLLGGPSLMHETLTRARTVVSDERVCTIVAAQHRPWWKHLQPHMPNAGVIVQPDNRGTAIGVLLALTHIVLRDRDARVVLLPSDHHVQDESILADSLRSAITHLWKRPDEILLLGITPTEPDPELGYIIPGARAVHGTFEVQQFVEKPSSAHAIELIRHGALWNAFIVAAGAQTLLSLLTLRFPEIVRAMRDAVQRDLHCPDNPLATTELYVTLPSLDFSRHVLSNGADRNLRVLPVPHCGWSDLGTSRRLAATLRQVRHAPYLCDSRLDTGMPISLAARLYGWQPHTGFGGIRGLHRRPAAGA